MFSNYKLKKPLHEYTISLITKHQIRKTHKISIIQIIITIIIINIILRFFLNSNCNNNNNNKINNVLQ